MEKDDINQDKLNPMFRDIRILEGENLKTQKYNDASMVKKIVYIIQKYAREEE